MNQIKKNQNLNWAILLTGWGRGAKNAIKAYKKGLLGNNIIKLLIYENEPSGAVEEAKKSKIKNVSILRKDFDTPEAYQDKIIDILKQENIDYIFLLNYKYIIRHKMLSVFSNRIVNIHPSLLPSFKNTSTAIQDALEYGVKVSGVTTHFIDDKIDEGIILCQKAIIFSKTDNFKTLTPKFVRAGKKIVIDTFNLVYNNHFE